MKVKFHASIIVTYRCNARCNMCNVWKSPTKPSEEIGIDVINKLPQMFFTNITGGEPFVRQDLPEIVEVIRRKTKRIVISTNGYFTDKIISLCKKFPDLGIRISIEGLQTANDTIRGIPHGFDHGLRTLLELRAMGIKDIGFGITVQDANYPDLIPLYLLADGLGYELATATLHNSHYFHKLDNVINNKAQVANEFKKLIKLFLNSRRVKNWFRAYYNFGLINYLYGNKRLLPCEMGEDGFFLDPHGDILACNGMNTKYSMGNLKEKDWEQIWHGERASEVRKLAKNCGKNCWMIGSVAPAIWHHPLKPVKWLLKNKIRLWLGKELDIDNQITRASKAS